MLTVTKDRYTGHARSPWLVVVPRRLSPTGRRQYRRFSTRASAQTFAASIRGLVRATGEQPLAAVPAQLAADAQAAMALLEGTGLTLTDAVRQLLEGGTPSGVAIPCASPTGGAGAGDTQEGGQMAAPGAAAPLTLHAMLQLMEQAKSHQAAATKRTRRSVCNALFARVPELASMDMRACTPAVLHNALDTCWAHSPQSWNTGRRVLSALFGYAIKRQLITGSNPLGALDLKHVQEGEITALPPADLRALFDACRPPTAQEVQEAAAMAPGDRQRALADTTDLRCYIAVCAFAGVRPVECSRLTWGDVDVEDGVLSVRAGNSKTGGCRHIELHPALRAWLEAYRPADAGPDTPITPPRGLTLRLQAMRRRAGYSPTRPWQNDCLRHSYATYYLKAGGQLQQLQLNMGHRDMRLLYSRYTNMRGVTRAMADSWWRVLPDVTGGAGAATTLCQAFFANQQGCT